MQPSAGGLVALFVAWSVSVASAQPAAPPPFEVSPDLLSVSDSGTPVAAAAATPNEGEATPSFLRSVGRDVRNFFSTDTAKIVGAFAIAGLAVHPIDAASVEQARARVPNRAAEIGNWIGSLSVQAGIGLATLAVGAVADDESTKSLGGDLLRAQILSQMFVQGTKYVAGRERPDGSNSLSFPSGHTASAFATATVFQAHFGWKAGVPAYAVAGFVGASRMASGKHYLSDVLVGAGIGIAGGRTVTIPLRRSRFSVGAAPTSGGAMMTFTKQDSAVPVAQRSRR